jgi:sulfide:quinone oxidoreductase
MAHIVILGAGIGGIPMAYEMKELAKPGDRITVVSNLSYFHFVPSNPWVAVNWRTPDDIKIELRPYLERKGIDFIVSGLKEIAPAENRLELMDGTRLDYDYLVIATGPRLAFDEVEGLGPEGHTQSVCHIDHALSAAKEWEKFVENPGPIVVGASQLASCFGPAYEFAFIMDADLRKRRIRDKVPMTLVTPEPYIGHLGLGGVGDSRGMLESALRDKHINFITNAKVEKVEEGKMHVLEMDENGQEKKRHELPFNYSMMLPAFTGIEPFMNVEGLVNPRGFILIDKHQRNPNFQNIFAVGVCVAIPPVEATPVPTGAPKTGYMIESMVTATARNIRDLIDGRDATWEATWNAVCLADMGDTGIAFVAMPQIPPRNVTWAKSGKWVHVAKVAFEKYFMRKVKKGASDSYIENSILKLLGIEKLKEVKRTEE